MWKNNSFLFKHIDSEDTNDENHKATGEWDGRRRSAAAAAASRRRAKQRKEAQGATHGMGGADTNHTLSSMANKPPQDRPDAKNHLKVMLTWHRPHYLKYLHLTNIQFIRNANRLNITSFSSHMESMLGNIGWLAKMLN